MSVGQFGICCCAEDAIPEEEEMESLMVHHPSASYVTGRLAQLDWSMIPPKVGAPTPPRLLTPPLRNAYFESFFYGGPLNPTTLPNPTLTTDDGEPPEPWGGFHFDGFWKTFYQPNNTPYLDPPRVWIDPPDISASNYLRLLYQRQAMIGQAGWVLTMPQSNYVGRNLDAQDQTFGRRSRFRVTYAAAAWNATADMVWGATQVFTDGATGKKLTAYGSPRLANVRLLSQFTTVPLQWYEASPAATGYANARCIFYVIEESPSAWQARTGYQFVA